MDGGWTQGTERERVQTSVCGRVPPAWHSPRAPGSPARGDCVLLHGGDAVWDSYFAPGVTSGFSSVSSARGFSVPSEDLGWSLRPAGPLPVAPRPDPGVSAPSVRRAVLPPPLSRAQAAVSAASTSAREGGPGECPSPPWETASSVCVGRPGAPSSGVTDSALCGCAVNQRTRDPGARSGRPVSRAGWPFTSESERGSLQSEILDSNSFL